MIGKYQNDIKNTNHKMIVCFDHSQTQCLWMIIVTMRKGRNQTHHLLNIVKQKVNVVKETQDYEIKPRAWYSNDDEYSNDEKDFDNNHDDDCDEDVVKGIF